MKDIIKGVIDLESEILKRLNFDNIKKNTFHFFYSESGLTIYSKHPIFGTIFELIRVESDSKLECLNLVLDSLEIKEEFNWTVTWVDDLENLHNSYFRADCEDEVRKKFFTVNDGRIIISIRKMPIS